MLRECLRQWSFRGDVGIPQGYSASDILAKLFANTLDNLLLNNGYTHLRYVDDIRIFCKSKVHAKKAILDLSRYIHDLGLNLQSAKTLIHTSNDAVLEITGTIKTIEGIKEEIMKEIREHANEEGPYPINPEYISQLLERLGGNPPEVIERAFRENFSVASGQQFDKSLFHYLINRLGDINSKFAVNYCLETLKERPDETADILSYFDKIVLSNEELDKITEIVISVENIYEYQKYLLLKFYFDKNFKDYKMIRFARDIVRNISSSPWFRSYAIVYLGKFGNAADIDHFLTLYAETPSVIEQGHIVQAIKGMELAARNAFYGRIERSNDLISIAVRYAKIG